jgi:hypothetical protein
MATICGALPIAGRAGDDVSGVRSPIWITVEFALRDVTHRP